MGDAGDANDGKPDLMQALLEQNAKLLDLLKQQKTAAAAGNLTMEDLARSMEIFAHEEAMGATFDRWFERYEGVLEQDAASLADDARTRLVLRKLDSTTYQRYADLLAPVKPNSLNYADTIANLKKYFGSKESLVVSRFKALQLRCQGGQDLQSFAGQVNKKAENFKISTMTVAHLKALLFVCGLERPEHKSFRQIVLEKLEKTPDAKLDELLEACERWTAVKKDVRLMGADEEVIEINAIQKRRLSKPNLEEQKQRQPWRSQQKDRSSRNGSDDEDELQCWNCLGPHMAKDCTRRQMECFGCGQLGHRKQFCKEARRSQRPMVGSLALTRQRNREENRCYAEMEVNGRPTKLLVDTGADLSVITKKTWHKLGSPKLQGGVKAADGVNGSLIKLKGSFTCSFRQSSRKEVHHGRCHVLASDNGLDVMGNGWLATLGYMDQLKSRLNGKSQADQQCVKKIDRRKLKLSREGNGNGLPQTGTKSLPKQYRPADGSRKKEHAQVPKKVGKWNRQSSNLTRTEDRQLGQAAHVNTVLRSSINGDRKERSQEAVTPKTRNEALQRKSEAASQKVSELKTMKSRNAKKPVVKGNKPRQTRTLKSRADQPEEGLRVNTVFTSPTTKDSKTEQKPEALETRDELFQWLQKVDPKFWKVWTPAEEVQPSNLTCDGNDGKAERAVYEDRMDTGPNGEQVRQTRTTPHRPDQGKKTNNCEGLGSMDSPSGGGVE